MHIIQQLHRAAGTDSGNQLLSSSDLSHATVGTLHTGLMYILVGVITHIAGAAGGVSGITLSGAGGGSHNGGNHNAGMGGNGRSAGGGGLSGGGAAAGDGLAAGSGAGGALSGLYGGTAGLNGGVVAGGSHIGHGAGAGDGGAISLVVHAHNGGTGLGLHLGVGGGLGGLHGANGAGNGHGALGSGGGHGADSGILGDLNRGAGSLLGHFHADSGRVLAHHNGAVLCLHGDGAHSGALQSGGAAGGALGDNNSVSLAGDGDVLSGNHDDAALCVHNCSGLGNISGNSAVQNGHHGGAVDVLGGSQVAVDAVDDAGFGHGSHIARSPIGHRMVITIVAQVDILHGLDAQRTAQHDHGLLTGDGLVGIGIHAVTLHNAGSSAAVDDILGPVAIGVAEAGAGGLGQVQQAGQDGGQLTAGQFTVGVKQAVAALDDAIVTPAVNGLFSPVAVGVGEPFTRCNRRRNHCHDHAHSEQ